MKKYSKRELNQHSGRILREIEETGEPALIAPGNGRGGKSFIISPAPETRYERGGSRRESKVCLLALQRLGRAGAGGADGVQIHRWDQVGDHHDAGVPADRDRHLCGVLPSHGAVL